MIIFVSNIRYKNNQLLKLNAIQSLTNDELSTLLKQRYDHHLNALGIKYVEVLSGTWWASWKAYYEIPDPQVVSLDTLVKK